jgi:hypothetical protein
MKLNITAALKAIMWHSSLKTKILEKKEKEGKQ